MGAKPAIHRRSRMRTLRKPPSHLAGKTSSSTRRTRFTLGLIRVGERRAPQSLFFFSKNSLSIFPSEFS